MIYDYGKKSILINIKNIENKLLILKNVLFKTISKLIKINFEYIYLKKV